MVAESGGKELLNMTETDDEYAISINIRIRSCDAGPGGQS